MSTQLLEPRTRAMPAPDAEAQGSAPPSATGVPVPGARQRRRTERPATIRQPNPAAATTELATTVDQAVRETVAAPAATTSAAIQPAIAVVDAAPSNLEPAIHRPPGDASPARLDTCPSSRTQSRPGRHNRSRSDEKLTLKTKFGRWRPPDDPVRARAWLRSVAQLLRPALRRARANNRVS